MSKKNLILLMITLYFLLVITPTCSGDQNIIAKKIARAPVIDGAETDQAWLNNPGIITHDKTAGIDISIKAAYTDAEIYFLVVYPDKDESREHKPWIWNREMKKYEMGPEREDVFVFKWNMGPENKDLSVYSDTPYVADIWFWKACRTDPTGFADDKIQQLQRSAVLKSMKLTSRSGKPMFLIRQGDNGEAAYTSTILLEYTGDKVPQFRNIIPQGSRANIRAKGLWAEEKWTIEFGRKLDTGNLDDIRFSKNESYLFGISRYEIAGREPDPSLSQPLFGSGDVSENLYLVFEERADLQ